ncbi:MAG: NAD(P)-dependent oxidoreductase [Alphaproteobacteria bacterium]|nr:NAD(P)-dependent oxidoreductase [Alphaproteobacteria bacterium]
MSSTPVTAAKAASGVASGRLDADAYAENFSDLHPLFEPHEALVEADRCYFCYDAPCVQACPTGIDIPMFIRQIATGNTLGSAETIFDANILGGMCARVCPTETLCEQACVRHEAEEKPVRIGRLQRYATDHAIREDVQFYERKDPTGKHVAVVGAGPAGLACAHALAREGHAVTLYDAKKKLGGLNEYGIAAYKTVDDFAQKEVDYILAIGGIELKAGVALGRDIHLATLQDDFDAVFLSLGMGGANDLDIKDADLGGVHDAIDFIADIRQAPDLSALPVGRSVVVIGGGMTAIDIASQVKRLGAEDVTIVYRRGAPDMKASEFEQHLAQTTGVRIKHWAIPKEIIGEGGRVRSIVFDYVAPDAGGALTPTGESFTLAADQVFKAIGQNFLEDALGSAGVALKRGRIAVDADRRTNLETVWAGGDCIEDGLDLTVAAVEDGKIAARAINAHLASGG